MKQTTASPKLWQLPYTLLFVSRVSQDLAHGFASIAFVWLLVENGGDAVSTSILFFSSLVPQMLLSSFISPLLTKGKLQHWMFYSDTIRAAAVLAIPVSFAFDALPLWLFFASALIQSAVAALYLPASVALLPRVIEKHHIQAANAFQQSSSQVVVILGLAGAGAVIQFFSAVATLVITAGLLFLSAFLILLVRDKKVPVQQAVAEEKKMRYLEQVKEGYTIVRQHKLLFGLNLFAIFLNLGSTPFMALTPIYVTDYLHGDAATLTMIRTSLAVGALLMGLFLAKVNIPQQGALFTYAGIVSGATLSLMGTTDAIWFILLASFLKGMTISAINVPELVIVQTTVPQHQQAQVFSILTTFSFALIPFASLASGQLAAWIGPEKVIALGGWITLLSGVAVLLFTSLAKMRVDTELQKEAV